MCSVNKNAFSISKARPRAGTGDASRKETGPCPHVVENEVEEPGVKTQGREVLWCEWRSLTLEAAVGHCPGRVGSVRPQAGQQWEHWGPGAVSARWSPWKLSLAEAERKGHSHGEGWGAREQLILRAPQAMLSSLEFSKDRSMCRS